jgi:CRISPR-associated protein Cas2
MLLIAYDISKTKLRTRFAKFLKRFGYRKQYSVFEIKNSDRILQNIQLGIKCDFEPQFSQTDSVMIIETSENCKITRYGYAKNDESDLIIA